MKQIQRREINIFITNHQDLWLIILELNYMMKQIFHMKYVLKVLSSHQNRKKKCFFHFKFLNRLDNLSLILLVYQLILDADENFII